MTAAHALHALPAADPRRLSTELGELAAIHYRTPTGKEEHRFAGSLPLLSYHEGGLLVAGGAYSILEGRVVNRRSSGRVRARARVPPKDAETVKAAIAQYRRDHWGEAGPRQVTRVRAADPRVLSRELGELLAVVYRTRKGDDRELTDYEHPFKRPRPTLSYHAGGLIVSGGVYHVTERGIID